MLGVECVDNILFGTEVGTCAVLPLRVWLTGLSSLRPAQWGTDWVDKPFCSSPGRACSYRGGTRAASGRAGCMQNRMAACLVAT